MDLTRRTFVTFSAGTAFGLALPAAAASKPDSKIRGVQIGTITYSFREMKDQSAEAILKYCVDSGISAIELMGDAAEAYAGIPVDPNRARLGFFTMRRYAPNQAPLTAEEQQEMLAITSDYHKVAAAWRATASLDKFKQLRRVYNAAGVSIYGFKPSVFEATSTQAEIDYGLRAAKALGASHVTVELPTDVAFTKRLGDAAESFGLRMAYHNHLQATPTLWDAALAASKGNAINLDLGHFTAAGDFDGIAFIRKHHARIASMHMKDRKTKANGAANLAWGEGDTPLANALRLMRDQKYSFPATIELEYAVPAGSDSVKEVARCLEYCRQALTRV
jgi:sugar phosphate isomerase/epimerase